MAQGKSKAAGNKSSNDDRHCKKAFKKRPGVSAKAHSGKTVDGYSPAKIAQRATRRAAVDAKAS